MIDIPMNTKPPVSLSAMAMGQPAAPQPVPQYQQPAQQPAPQYQQPAHQQTVPQPAQAPQQSAGKGVILRKGQKFGLTSPSGVPLTQLKVGLSWESNLDLDVECFMLGQNGKVLGDDWFVFYGSLQSPDGSVIHSGDCKDGAMPGDDEVITVNLQRLNTSVAKLVFVVSIDQAKEQGYNFSMVQNARLHVMDCQSGSDLCEYRLTEYYPQVTSMVIGELYLHNGQWKFNPVGNGTQSDLYDLCRIYGVNVQA